MTIRSLALLLTLLPVAVAAQSAQKVCSQAPSAQVYSFVAPPPASPPVRAALQLGRGYLRRGEKLVGECAGSAASLPSGYVVATLSRGGVSFSVPEGAVPVALQSCLEHLVQRLGMVPAAFGAAEAQKEASRDLEVGTIWFLHPPVGRSAPPWTAQRAAETRRSFAEIETEVGRHLPALTACFAELWEEHPHAAGTLVLRLAIAESGLIDGTEVLRRELSMQAAEECLLHVFGRLRFSPRWGNGRTVMSYPLVLSPSGS